MSIDHEIWRVASSTQRVAGNVDVEEALGAFHAARRRRHRSRVVAAVAVAGAVLAAAGTIEGSLSTWSPREAGVVAPGPSPGQRDFATHYPDDASPDKHGRCLGAGAVRCLGPTTLVDGAVRYRVTAPRSTWSAMEVENAPESTEVQLRHRDGGVAFFIDPRPVGAAGSIRSAAGLAAWVASRPFLLPTAAEPTRVDGAAAWQVDAVVDESEWPLEDSCLDFQPSCRALFSHYGQTHQTGPWRTMLSRYTFVDGPGRHILVIWSWAFDEDHEAMALNAELVHTVDVLPAD